MKRRKHNRHKAFDYSEGHNYFVTLCVQNRLEALARIDGFDHKLSKLGIVVKKQWLWFEKHFPYVELDEYIIMPNHVHGILTIRDLGSISNVGTGRLPAVLRTVLQAGDLSLPNKIKPLPELIGAFKTTSSKLIHQSGAINFSWQRSYYDHVIRSEVSLNRIRNYIYNNPVNWHKDIENRYVNVNEHQRKNYYIDMF